MEHPFFCIMSTNWNDITQQAKSDATNTETDSVFWNWFFPGAEQREQFGQQVALQEMQNQWNSETSKMARAKEAGINLNTAAAAIAGGNASSASVPPSMPQSASIGDLASLGQNAASVAELPSSIARNKAEAKKLDKEADNVDRLSDAEVLSKASVFAKNLTDSGTPEIEAMVTALSVCRGGLDGIFAALKGDGVCRLIQTKQDKIEADYSKTWKDIEAEEWNIKHTMVMIDEVTKKNLLLDIERRKQEAITQREEQLSKLWQDYDGDPYLDLYQREYQIIHEYGVDSPQYEAFMKGVKDLSFNQQHGLNEAEIEDGYMKAFAKLKAEADINADFAPYLAMIEANKQAVIEFIKMMTDNPDNIQGIISKLINLIGQFGLSGQLDKGVVNTAKKPDEGFIYSRR